MAQSEKVRKMFNNIAPRYDLLNHLLSLGIDRSWRRRLVRELKNHDAGSVLDVATGTADLAILAARKGVEKVTGVDIAEGMLAIGEKKLKSAGLEERITLRHGKAEKLPFSDKSFDAAMVAFGVRNFADLDHGMKEMHRVIRKDGLVCVLEFSTPRRFPMKQFYLFYFRHILPRLGGWISGDRGAYEYLPATVLKFPQGKTFLSIMGKAGFSDAKARKMSGGIATLYTGLKK